MPSINPPVPLSTADEQTRVNYNAVLRRAALAAVWLTHLYHSKDHRILNAAIMVFAVFEGSVLFRWFNLKMQPRPADPSVKRFRSLTDVREQWCANDIITTEGVHFACMYIGAAVFAGAFGLIASAEEAAELEKAATQPTAETDDFPYNWRDPVNFIMALCAVTTFWYIVSVLNYYVYDERRLVSGPQLAASVTVALLHVAVKCVGFASYWLINSGAFYAFVSLSAVQFVVVQLLIISSHRGNKSATSILETLPF